MNNKRITCIALALGAILSASPAHAYMAVHETDFAPNQSAPDFVVVSTQYETIVTNLCGYNFNYEQRMGIGGGPPVVALVTSLYSPGRKDLYEFGMSCDGYHIYGLGDCAC